MINIPNDLRKNKDKIIGNMDLRECICVFLGVVLAIAFLYYFRIVLGYQRVIFLAFFAGLIVIPFLFFGFKRINGMKVDDYFKVFINNNILSHPVRINKYRQVDAYVKDKKYELVRCYKLKDKDEMLKLRKFLLDKNILYLSEYISYKNEQYVIFRINCKDMELLQEKRNKDAILVKNNKIKNSDKKCKLLFIDISKLKIKRIKERITKKVNETTLNKLKNLQKEQKETKKLNKKLKNIRQKLKLKKLNIFKDEIDIFEDFGIHASERTDDIKALKDNIINDERNIYELNLFDKTKIKDFVSDKDKFVFISNDGKLDIFIYDDGSIVENARENIIDLLAIDKKLSLYESIKILEARNLYNFYRNINNLEDVL